MNPSTFANGIILHSANIYDISSTLLVSKLAVFKKFKAEHPLNILAIDFTFSVLKKVKDKSLNILEIDRLDNISDEERDNKEDYISLMKKNIEVLRKGLDN